MNPTWQHVGKKKKGQNCILHCNKVSSYVDISYKETRVCIARVIELRIFFFVFQIFNVHICIK